MVKYIRGCITIQRKVKDREAYTNKNTVKKKTIRLLDLYYIRLDPANFGSRLTVNIYVLLRIIQDYITGTYHFFWNTCFYPKVAKDR